MKKVKLFFQKLIPFLKKRGLKGVIIKVFQKLHIIPEKARVLEDYNYIVDEKKVPLNKKEYELKRDNNIKILNWIIPEMGKGSGGHLNIFRFISNLENMGFHSRLYLFKSPNYRDNESVKAFLRENFPVLDLRVEAFWDVKLSLIHI